MDKRRIAILGAGASLSVAALLPVLAGRLTENPVQRPARIRTEPKSTLSSRQLRKARKAEKRAAALEAILSEAAQRAQAQKGQA